MSGKQQKKSLRQICFHLQIAAFQRNVLLGILLLLCIAVLLPALRELVQLSQQGGLAGSQIVLGARQQYAAFDMLADRNAELYQDLRKREDFAFAANQGFEPYRQVTPSDLRHPNYMHVWDYFLQDFVCPSPSYIGHIGDGGKWVCALKEIVDRPGCVIYSLGSDGESSFEEAMEKLTQCEIHIFDPTLDESRVQGMMARLTPERTTFHDVGISDREETLTMAYSGRTTRNAALKPLPTLMQELGHTWVDVLKIDIEGYEGKALRPHFQQGWLPFGQILVELHNTLADMKLPQIYGLLWGLEQRAGYRIFSRNVNLYSPRDVWEYALIRVDATGRPVGPEQGSRAEPMDLNLPGIFGTNKNGSVLHSDQDDVKYIS